MIRLWKICKSRLRNLNAFWLLAIFRYCLAFLIGESHDKSNAFLVMSLGWMMVEKRGRRGQVALGEKYSVETMEMDRK